MENRRETQPDPLLRLTHGALALSNSPYPATVGSNSLQGQSGSLTKETHGAPSPSDEFPIDDSGQGLHPKVAAGATNGAPKGTDIHDVDKHIDNGILESQQHPRLATVDHPSKDTEDHAFDRRGKQRKSAFQNTLENFTPMWFALPMNTGILAILMRLLPYQFNGLPVLSTIMYLFDLTLFVVISSVTILRWTLYPKAAQQKTAASIDEISFLGAAPIAFLTLTGLTGIIVSNAYWGGHAWSLVAYVMWWFGMAWMLATCTCVAASCRVTMLTLFPGIGVCITLFRANLIDDRSMTPSPILSAVGVATAAFVGGEVVTYAYNISPRLAVPVIIVGYLVGGLAIWLSVILYAVFFHRLMASGWPEPAKRPSLMMLVSH